MAKLDSPLQLFLYVFERLIDHTLADGRADRAQAEAVFVEQRFEFLNLEVGEFQYVRFQDGTEFDETHTTVFQDIDLFLRIGRNLVGKCAECKHEGPPATPRAANQSSAITVSFEWL